MSIRPVAGAASPPPAMTRLSRLAALAEADLAALRAAEADGKVVRARREILAEGQEITETRLLLAGWAARVRLLPDGRRQFLNFLLPGDLVGCCGHSRPLAVATVTALTDVTLATAPPGAGSAALREAYAVSRAMEEAHLLAQVVRLGRLNAQDRIGDLLLELDERLRLAGLAGPDGFELPITQETLADALGLTSVHINRMLQLMRRDGGVVWRQGRVRLPDPAGLALRIGRAPVRVTASAPATAAAPAG